MPTDLWGEIVRRLREGGSVSVATIVTREGSAPRSAGAKMLVDSDGLIAGTLGGGPAEARAEEEARACLADGMPRLFSVDMSGSARDGADLICGGMVRIFVHRLDPSMAGTFETLRERARLGLTSFLVTPIQPPCVPVLLTPERGGDLAAAVRDAAPDAAMLFAHDGADHALEPLYARTRLVLAGGGHVSLATARLALAVGFDVAVLDDRPEFVAAERFPGIDAGRLLTTPAFADCLSERVLGFPVSPNTFVAILTRGHSFDSEVLAQALHTPAGYIGMIGSRRKRAAVDDQMRKRGFGQADLDRVHSPIGLPIGAETPEEIAVSIVAELIAARAGSL